MRDGIIDELKAQGYEDSQIEYKCAAGDSTALTTIVTNMTDGTYDMVFTIATPPTQAMVNTETDTPVFFCAVSAPVAAGVITDMDKPDKNATGTSNAIPVSKIIDLAQATTPVKKIGLIYSGNEDNATNTVKQCEEYLKSINVEYVEKTGTTNDEISLAADALVAAGVDAVFTPTDNTVMTAELAIYEKFVEAGIPHYAGADSFALNGAFCGFGVNYVDLGTATADIVVDILVNGKDPATTAVQTMSNGIATVNTDVASQLGIDYSVFDGMCEKVVEIQTAEEFE